MKQLYLKFKGIDDWNRPIYQDQETKQYYGSTNTLFPNRDIPTNEIDINRYFNQNLQEIEYFGNQFGCEPMGGRPGVPITILHTKERFNYGPTDPNDRGGTGHGDASYSDADPGL